MAEVFQPSYHVPIPPGAKVVERSGRRYARFKTKAGRTVEGLILPGGAKCRVQTPGYYARIRHPDGRIRRVALDVTDQEAARQLRTQLQLQADQERAGIVDPYDRHRRTPLIGSMNELPKRRHERSRHGRIIRPASDLARCDLDEAIAGSHLADYALHLRAGGRTERHIQEVTRTIRRVAIACKFEFMVDLDSGLLDRYLAGVIEIGRSRRTRNAALKSLRAMTSWLVRTDRLQRDPLRTLSTINEEGDPRSRRRRALTAQEFELLIKAAEGGGDQTTDGVSGAQRGILFLTAAWTGLRRKELGDLLLSHLSLEGEPPFVHIPAASTKARRDDQPIPLHPYVAKKLVAWAKVRRRAGQANVFDLKTRSGQLRKTSKMMRLDCEAAGIPYVGDLGTADFHSHRLAFITRLCRSCSDFSTIVSLSRHRDPKLTAKTYDRVRLENRVAAIAAMTPTTTIENHLGTEESNKKPKSSRKTARSAKQTA